MEPEQKTNVIKFTKEPYVEDVGPRKIKSIKFSMLSGDEIRKASEVQVWNNRYYGIDKKPIVNGLLDLHLGPPNKNLICETCNGKFADCPGHFGYLSLVLPVFNIGYFGSILQILKCICKSCSRILLLDRDHRDYLRKMRGPRMDALQKTNMVKIIMKKCKDKCRRCGYTNGKVKKAGSILAIVHDRSKILDGTLDDCKKAISHTKESKSPFQVVQVLNPVRVLSLFKRIPDEDCELLYVSDRPEKLIVTDIAIPPTALRPSIFSDGGKISNEDDITSRLSTIIQTNTSLRHDLQCMAPVSTYLVQFSLLHGCISF